VCTFSFWRGGGEMTKKQNSIKAELDCEVVAINVDHGIRQTSAFDTEFVMQFCKDHKIRAYKFKGEAIKVAKEEKLTLEQ
jgi:tRNA(Ile)-lysidine synthase TilS/MesJ